VLKITIVGKGRLGRSLHEIFAMHQLQVQLLGRSPSLAGDEDVVLIAVPDDRIASVAGSLNTKAVILHCSGVTDWRCLRPHQPAGWFHPLMTFPGPEVCLPDLKGVPIAIDGDPVARELAHELARRIEATALPVPGDPRLYHCAAVLAGNLTTVLFAQACRVLERAGVPADQTGEVLLPLAQASLRNAAAHADRSLTGPAVRGDTQTLHQHRDALSEHGFDDMRILYDALTEHAQSLGKDLTSSDRIRKER
jgi:predicted short-subunit dehydrogenase-like oxidoreductase (DUF2520 family)